MKHKMSLILFGTLIVLMIGSQATGVSAGDPGKIPIPAPDTLSATSAMSPPWAPLNHNHLGQTWTGSNPLVITGTYGAPLYAPLVLSNDNVDGYGLRILSSARNGVVVDSATRNGFTVASAGTNGFRVQSAGSNGLAVISAGNGVGIESVSGFALWADYVGSDGIVLGEVGGNGMWVGSAGENGLSVDNAGSNGVWIGNAGVLGVGVDYAKEVAYWVNKVDGSGLWVGDAGGQAIGVGSAGQSGLLVESAGDDGVYVKNAGNNGVQVDSAGVNGLHVQNAIWNGVQIDSAYDGVVVDSANHTGLGVRSAGGDGVWVGSAGNHGVAVYSANNEGVLVASAGDNGLWVQNAGNNGVRVDSAGGYAGLFNGSIYARDGCVGCTITMFGANAGSVALQPGDIVSIQGLLPSQFSEVATLMQVKAAEKGETVIGVVQGRAEVNSETNPQPGKAEDHLVPRQGDVEPGGYVTIIIYGPAQVKASALSGLISAGTRLTLGDDGGVRTLKTTEVNGVQIAESASTIGIALEGLGDNKLIWVLVNPQ